MSADRQAQPSPRGFSQYRVVEKQQESSVITSFVLTAADGSANLKFRPGQHLILRLPQADGGTLLRTYSLSGDVADPAQLRISVKREPAPFDRPELPAGLGSNYLHDQVQVGGLLDIAGPAGDFVLHEESERPVVLFSGGVGLTPMMSMLHKLSASGSRAVHFIHACENGEVHAFRDEVLALAERRPAIHAHFCYRSPTADDRAQHSTGLVSRETLQQLLPLDDYEVYLCGPRMFMQANWRLLRSLGIAKERIHYEFFGPATILEEDDTEQSAPAPAVKPAPVAVAQNGAGQDAETFSVHFLPSGTTVAWDPSCHSLLDLAEQAGLTPAFNCRAGLCNTCQVDLREGEVEYFEEPLDAPANGSLLLCCSRPRSGVTIDLGA